jgi:hypothetical protein
MSTALVATEQRSHEEIKRKASRMDAAQHQIVSKQLSEFVPQSSFGNPGSAPGVNRSAPHTSDACRQPIADPLGYAPGKSASILDASRAVRDGTKNNADSVTSRGSAQVVQYVDSYPLPRYAQGLSQTLTTHDNNNRDDIHQGNNIVQAELTEFPRHKMRDLERPDHTTPPQNDGDSDVSRSMRGHRITGPVPVGDYSDNFTQDLGEMIVGAGMSTNEFCSTESSSARRAQEMSRAFEGPPSITHENGRGNDHSRSLRRQTATRQTWQDEDSQAIANDLSFSSHSMAIDNAAWENGARTRDDGTGQLVIIDSREDLQHYYIGEEGYAQRDVPIFMGPSDVYDDTIMVPRRKSRAQAPGQRGEHGIIDHKEADLLRRKVRQIASDRLVGSPLQPSTKEKGWAKATYT